MDVLNVAVGLVTVMSGLITIVFALKRNGVKNGDDKTETETVPPKAAARKPAKSNQTAAPTKVPVGPAPVKPATAGVREFVDDDAGYQKWIEANPKGFVVNATRGYDPRNMPLHNAMCGHISNFASREQGAFTERAYIKVCATETDPLREWVKTHGRADGSFTGKCSCISQ